MFADTCFSGEEMSAKFRENPCVYRKITESLQVVNRILGKVLKIIHLDEMEKRPKCSKTIFIHPSGKG